MRHIFFLMIIVILGSFIYYDNERHTKKIEASYEICNVNTGECHILQDDKYFESNYGGITFHLGQKKIVWSSYSIEKI